MSRRWIRPFVAVALFAGVGAGVVIALVVPTRSHGTPQPPRITVLPPRHQRSALNELVLAPKKGTVRIELTAADPRGGPRFAVRAFRAVRRMPPGLGGPRPTALRGEELCAQLGRIYQGRFGWIDAQNRFRPARFNYDDAPILCDDRWRDARSDAELTRTTLITNPLLAAADPTETVVWGIGGSLLRTVTLQGAGIHTAHPKPSPRGAFLAFADPTGPSTVSATFTYEGRPNRTLALDPARPSPVPPPLNRFEHGVLIDTVWLEARAPDPTGGLAWGIEASRTRKGGYCAWDVGQLVGSHVGHVNYALGTFSDAGVLPCLSKPRFPLGMPLAIGISGEASQPDDPAAAPDPGHIALRTLPGRTVISGTARPDVREITIETPRDIRTIVPSARAHAFIVVYDGTFPTGDTVFTVTLADGTRQVQRLPSGPF